MNGGGEGDGRKTDWNVALQVAGFLFGVAAFASQMADDDQARAVELEKRLCRIEAALSKGECGQ